MQETRLTVEALRAGVQTLGRRLAATAAALLMMGAGLMNTVQADETIKVPAWLNDPIYYHNRGNSNFFGEDSLYGDFAGLDDLMTENPLVVGGTVVSFTNTGEVLIIAAPASSESIAPRSYARRAGAAEPAPDFFRALKGARARRTARWR